MINESCKIYERYSCTHGEAEIRLFYTPEWAGRFVCESDFFIDRHGYDSLLLLYTISGVGKLTYRGEEFILDSGKIAIIHCEERHIYFPAGDEPWDFRFIHFSAPDKHLLYERIYGHGGCVFSAKKHIGEMISACTELCKRKPTDYEVEASKILSDIIYFLLRSGIENETDSIALACKHIAENYYKKLSTKDIADLCGFSRCYFATVFKKATGKTLHDYILCYRLDKAKELLAENRLSISEIAEKSGFGDLGTFIRAFKKSEKKTPLKFRNDFR